MAAPARYRYLRSRLRNHYFSLWIVFAAVLPGIAAYAWFNWAPGQNHLIWLTLAWAAFSLLIWLGSRRAEARHWRLFDGLSYWFEDGRLHSEGPINGAMDLSRVRKVNVFVSRGAVDRLAIWFDQDATPMLIVGIDRPEAFASELRRHAPRARYETVMDWL